MGCTGYTHLIENGEAKTGKDFLKVCLRAFGVFAEYRDEPLSVELPKVEFTVDKRYIERLDSAKEELKKLEALSDEDWQKMYENDLGRQQKEIKERNEYNAKMYEKYESIKDDILRMQMSDSYKNIVDFALEQINMCMDSYKPLNENDYQVKNLKESMDGRAAAYKSSYLSSAKRSVEFAMSEYDRQVEAAKKQQSFLDGFLKEIGE